MLFIHQVLFFFFLHKTKKRKKRKGKCISKETKLLNSSIIIYFQFHTDTMEAETDCGQQCLSNALNNRGPSKWLA